LKIQKEERLNKDLNSRVFADKKQNEEVREQLRDVEEKR
jgi:hypothetical protein